MAGNRGLNWQWRSTGVVLPQRNSWGWDWRILEPVLVSATLALSLHAVVFSVPARLQRPLNSSAWPSMVQAVNVRSVPGSNRSTTHVDQGSPESATVAPGLPVDSRPPTRFEPKVDTGLRSTHDRATPPVGAMAIRVAGVSGDDDFFPRHALDVGPYPAAPVLIEYPPVRGKGGTHASELSIFIDETGKVVNVRVDGQPLPQVMEEAARSAFMDAAFSPGLVDGLPVRSRIRIEVTFQAGAAPR